jgi:outer membrane protein OmpA-like peptidoglycan-associated protein
MLIRTFLFFSFLISFLSSHSQTNLLLNGGFEEINTCTEYKAECGVEAWFYLKDVKAQMLLNETNTSLLGANSFAIYYDWAGYTEFVPIIGTLLPCRLQKGNQYSFRGIMSAKLNPKLILRPGICTGDKFFVPRRPFTKGMQPDSITKLTRIPNTPYYQFEYNFIATGDERYLTFGSFIKEDTTGAKKRLYGNQTVAVILDNFSLTSSNPEETYCIGWQFNKESIYEFNSRHKEMDYSLFGKGELSIELLEDEKKNLTQYKKLPPPPKPDTLTLGDVLFDYNKAILKPAASTMLYEFFVNNKEGSIDIIRVEGHTDSIGTDARNIQLSKQRSEAVRDWLVTNSISELNSIAVIPFGRSKPIASNKTSQGRAMNRRVEIIVFRKR